MTGSNEFKLNQPPEDGISSVKFSPNTSQFLLVSSWDTSVRLYDVPANSLRLKYQHSGAVLDCAFYVRVRPAAGGPWAAPGCSPTPASAGGRADVGNPVPAERWREQPRELPARDRRVGPVPPDVREGRLLLTPWPCRALRGLLL